MFGKGSFMLKPSQQLFLVQHTEKVLAASPSFTHKGWITLLDVAKELSKHPYWENFALEEIMEALKESPFKSYKVLGGTIQAEQTSKNPLASALKMVIPPEKLYYGATLLELNQLRGVGIQSTPPKKAKLYADKQQVLVALSEKTKIFYVEIAAYKAHYEGIRFYKASWNCYLADNVPSKYMKICP